MLRSILRYTAIVLILFAAVAAAGAADVQALVAIVLFTGLAGLGAARRRADRAEAERRPAAAVACCDSLSDHFVCGSAILRIGGIRSERAARERISALLGALADEAARADEGSPKP